MSEFTSVSTSSFDPAGLATKLTEKSADGWTVVGIVSAGADIVAFLSREGGATPVAEAPAAAAAPVEAAAPVAAEPAGWATAPEAAPAAPAPEPAPVYTPAPTYDPQPAYQPAPVAAPAPAPAPAPAAAPSPTPAVPAGWYTDPAARFELRYWDGGTWTEHVSRQGQQYTDPPVA